MFSFMCDTDKQLKTLSAAVLLSHGVEGKLPFRTAHEFHMWRHDNPSIVKSCKFNIPEKQLVEHFKSKSM